MSVSAIHRFWDKRSLIFKVLIVVIIMVPLGFYNFVGASLILSDDIKNDKADVETIDIVDSTTPKDFDTELLNPDSDSTLLFIEKWN